MSRQIARTAALVALMAGVSVVPMGAQPRMQRGPNPDAPHLMVSACRTADKVLAVQCADRLRSQIEGDVSFRVLYVHPKADVENVLTASGYDAAVALAPADAVALAKQIRADMYVDAAVEKTGAGYKLTANVVLSRDANMAQPLGSFEHAKLENAVSLASRAYQEVFNKTFGQQKECFTLARERKYADAEKRFADGMKNLPRTAWLRYCKLGLMKDQKQPIAEIAKLVEELVEIDPLTKSGLRELVLIYDSMGEREKKVSALERLQAADPTDARLVRDIVNELAAMGNFDKALPLAEKAMASNQGDIELTRTYWAILNAKQLHKRVIETGKLMVTMDTASADSTYFARMIGAASSDSNYAAAAEFADQGGVKFPKTQFNMLAYAAWRRAGNQAKSLVAARRALAADPKTPNIRAGIAATYLAENPPKVDEAIALAKEMIANGEDKNQIAGVAVQSGNILRTQVDTMRAKGADAAALHTANERAYDALVWADSLSKGTTVEQQAKFLVGVSALSVGQGFLTQASEIGKKVGDEMRAMKPVPDAAKQRQMTDAVYPQACALIVKANEFFTTAQAAVPAGGRFNPPAAQQVMGALMQMNSFVEQSQKVYCRAGSPGNNAGSTKAPPSP